jgi:hypothetical protein
MMTTLIRKTKNYSKNYLKFLKEKNPFMLLKAIKPQKLPPFIIQHAKSNSHLIEAPKNDYRNESANGRETS